jgi:hypothetical protein
MKKILWVSRNTPLESQINYLKQVFGEDTEITEDSKPFSSAQDIAHRFEAGNYDEMVVIAPISVCRILTDMGYRLLWSEMERTTKEDSEISVAGIGDRVMGTSRHYRFVRFKRLEGVDLIFSDLAIDK